MKRTLIYFIASLMIFVTNTVYATESIVNDGISVYIDSEKLQFDVQPQLINQRTMVPMRFIFERFGANVSYQEETRSILVGFSVDEKDSIMFMMADNPNVFVNQTMTTLDVPPTIVDGRTLVPIRFISETLGHEVLWDEVDRAVHINSN